MSLGADELSDGDPEFRTLIRQAHAGDREAVGALLERYRNYLGSVAQRRVGSLLNRRMGVSDLVQQTMIEAHQNFRLFAGEQQDELLGWLRRILHCNITNAIRDHLYTKKRTLALEQSLDSDPVNNQTLTKEAARSSIGTPSLQASQIEESLRLLDQLELLPSDQATAVRMRYLECRSILEIAAELNRTKSAAAGLVKRGMKKLRQQMKAS